MATARENFTDQQKAEIFVLDHALCSMTGKSLWLLDYGAAPSSVDWVDHIKASANSGKAVLENGACMSWSYNWLKRDSKGSMYLFHRGRPTEHFYLFHEKVSDEIAAHFGRFAQLHWSDWYFNRAIFHVLFAAGQHKQRRADGKPFTRDRNYWAAAAVGALKKWRSGSAEATGMERRGLVTRPLSEDRRILLSLTEMPAASEVKKVIAAIAPYVNASYLAARNTAIVEDQFEATVLRRLVRSDPFVVPRVKKAIQHNLKALMLPKLKPLSSR